MDIKVKTITTKLKQYKSYIMLSYYRHMNTTFEEGFLLFGNEQLWLVCTTYNINAVQIFGVSEIPIFNYTEKTT